MAAPADPSHYVIEYTKPGSSEKCNGRPPCNGTTIVLGDLRFGTKKYNNKINDKMQYRHWGCVTPDILYDLAFLDINRIPGMDRLGPTDRAKIHTAVERLTVDPADVPVTARRSMAAAPSGSQAKPPPFRVAAAPFGTQKSSAAPVAPAAGASKKRKAPSKKAAVPPPPVYPPPASQYPQPGLPTYASSQLSQPAYSQASQYPQQRPAPPAYPYGTQITMSQQQRDDENYGDDDLYEEEETQFTDFYLSFQSTVVGIQYYDGLVGPGEQVNLVREPHNKYDRNAIQVMNINMRQVGHIPRQTAASLAPLMDRGLISVEGTMNDGNLQGRQYTLNVTLSIYGKPGVRSMLEPLLTWATPGKRGFTDAMRLQSGVALAQTQGYSAHMSAGPSYAAGSSHNPMYIQNSSSSQPSSQGSQALSQAHSQAQIAANQRMMEMIEAQRRAEELRLMLAGLEKVDDEGRRSNFLDALYGKEVEDVLNLPEHSSPPGKEEGSLNVELLKHQKQGLLWCINRENATLPKKVGELHQQFWEYRSPPGQKGYYMNMITKTPVPLDMSPVIGHGGIMSDSMGLGKSLTFLALIIATKQAQPEGFGGSTLVVCPLSVLSNWESQISQHCVRGVISSYTYYGNNRNVDTETLKAYDIVLTTYQSVSSDFERAGGFKTVEQLAAESEAPSTKKRKVNKGLFEIQWKRVVLDEAHQIRNPKTKIARAVSALPGYYRWAVSGTPIVNSPTDLGSLLVFLRMCSPLDQIPLFNRLLARPLAKGNPESATLLKEIMKHISIRRSKEMQNAEGERLVKLPEVRVHITRIDLDPTTRQLYNAVEQLSRQRFLNMANAAENGEHVPNVVLSLLTRLRQIALHAGLVPADYLEKLRSEEAADNASSSVKVISAQEKTRLQTILFHAEEDSEECAICFDSLKDPRILPDGHYFCYECIAGLITAHGPEATCPMDRRPITMEDLIEPAPPTMLTQAPRPSVDDGFGDGLVPAHGSSPKIESLIRILKLIPEDEKVVVFSQFTTFLEKIADQLEINDISFVQFNGAMSAKRRQEVLESFSVPLAPRSSSSRRASGNKPPAGSDSDSDYVAPRDDDYIDEEDGSIFTSTQATKKKGKATAKGKGKAANLGRASGGNPKVLLISLKSGATGLNLTVANHLFLMDPWWQEAIESQAIDRVNRIGQKREVQVYQMITTDTVESKVLDIQARKKAMIDQAFSGMGGREVVREKREARMQDFIELFGLKREGGRVRLKDDDRNAPQDDGFIVPDDDDDELDWLPTKRSKGKKKAASVESE